MKVGSVPFCHSIILAVRGGKREVALHSPFWETVEVNAGNVTVRPAPVRDPESAPFQCLCGFTAFSQMLYEVRRDRRKIGDVLKKNMG